jgi:hypothetical protein
MKIDVARLLEAEPDQTIVASSNYLKRIFPFPDIL